MKNGQEQANAEIDLRGVMCPYNYIKTKLKLEGMAPGQILAVILDEGEAIQNVPRSVENDGHIIVQQEPYQSGHRILIRKTD